MGRSCYSYSRSAWEVQALDSWRRVHPEATQEKQGGWNGKLGSVDHWAIPGPALALPFNGDLISQRTLNKSNKSRTD
jgi:hypothetical protein